MSPLCQKHFWEIQWVAVGSLLDLRGTMMAARMRQIRPEIMKCDKCTEKAERYMERKG